MFNLLSLRFKKNFQNMSRFLFSIVLVFFIFEGIFAQSYWKNAEGISLRSDNRYVIPDRYKTFSLENEAFKEALFSAPNEDDFKHSKSGVNVFLPDAQGKLQEFVIWSSNIMEDSLAQKYPGIRSYKGYCVSERSTVVRMTWTPTSFHAAIKGAEETVYIDPYFTSGKDFFVVYNTEDHIDEALKDKILCGTDPANFDHGTGPKWGVRNAASEMKEFRKYRLALACTGEWGAVRGTVEKALSDMVTFIDRANVYFEAEVGLRLILVNSNDKLIQLDGSTDPYENPNQGLSILGQNTGIINQRIGFNNYEIGHVFSICFDVGGVAGGNICTQAKGAGVTCHNGAGISTGIVLVFVHEVGHQMTASHTFNNCPGQEGQATNTGYEPGSGSTIMAYPGACGASNLGVPRDGYYHVSSLNQILDYTDREGVEGYECAQKEDIGNFKPVIKMPYKDGFFIPKSTPFFLTADATDENNDPMTYNWEQFDAQGSSPLGAPTGNAPIFRSLRPGTSKTRFFPSMTRTLNWNFTDVTELMPTYGRDLTFRFIVRDNNPLGGATVWEEMKFKVAPTNIGPFQLTYPDKELPLFTGDKLDVTWDVNGTDIAPVNARFVDIFFALNNDLNFNGVNMIPVAKQVPNDGKETIIIPNVVSTRARVVVKASDNIFYTVAKLNSRIDKPTTPSFFMDVVEPVRTLCLPAEPKFDITTVGFAGLTEQITYEAITPEGIEAQFVQPNTDPGSSNQLVLKLDGVKTSGEYEITLRTFVPGIDTLDRVLRLYLTTTDVDFVNLASPENGVSGLGPTQRYSWMRKQDANTYLLQVATNPAFNTQDIVFQSERTDTFFNSNNFLKTASVYYWRVKSSNDCKDGAWSEIYAFNTEAKTCTTTPSGALSLNISQSGTPKVSSEIFVAQSGAISDVNVKNIRGQHQRSSDLVFTLVSPKGTKVELWSNRCPVGSGIFVNVDDQSNEFFQCPISTGRTYRPTSPLSVLNGENMEGIWKMIVEDTKTGDSGRFQNWDLELCSNISLNPPVLTNNKVLEIHPGNTKIITNSLLKSDDADNGPSELSYTLVAMPKHGVLVVNGAPLEAGATLSQKTIDDGLLSYIHAGKNELEDNFSFTVTDGKGGWISITNFLIDVDSAFPSSVKNIVLNANVLVYPNPAKDHIQVKNLSELSLNHYIISDMTGKMVKSSACDSETFMIDISEISAGLYTLQLATESGLIVRKIVVQ